MSTLTPLEVVKLVNTGVILWDAVGALIQRALENGTDVTMDDVEAASTATGKDLDALRAAIEAKKLRDA